MGMEKGAILKLKYAPQKPQKAPTYNWIIKKMNYM